MILSIQFARFASLNYFIFSWFSLTIFFCNSTSIIENIVFNCLPNQHLYGFLLTLYFICLGQHKATKAKPSIWRSHQVRPSASTNKQQSICNDSVMQTANASNSDGVGDTVNTLTNGASQMSDQNSTLGNLFV